MSKADLVRDSSNASEARPPRKRRTKAWLSALLVIAIAAFVGGGYVGGATLNPLKWGLWSSTTNTQVIKSIEFKQDVVLLALSSEGMITEKAGNDHIPGTGKEKYTNYSYKGQLGLDGTQVKIEQTGDKSYTITLPDFKFIGFSDFKNTVAVEKEGIISFVTPDISTDNIVDKVITDETKAKHLSDNQELLQAQAETFYTNIIHGIDPEITLEFK